MGLSGLDADELSQTFTTQLELLCTSKNMSIGPAKGAFHALLNLVLQHSMQEGAKPEAREEGMQLPVCGSGEVKQPPWSYHAYFVLVFPAAMTREEYPIRYAGQCHLPHPPCAAHDCFFPGDIDLLVMASTQHVKQLTILCVNKVIDPHVPRIDRPDKLPQVTRVSLSPDSDISHLPLAGSTCVVSSRAGACKPPPQASKQ